MVAAGRLLRCCARAAGRRLWGCIVAAWRLLGGCAGAAGRRLGGCLVAGWWLLGGYVVTSRWLLGRQVQAARRPVGWVAACCIHLGCYEIWVQCTWSTLHTDAQYHTAHTVLRHSRLKRAVGLELLPTEKTGGVRLLQTLLAS
jgi:hypothetical protein